jgi:hypothetical protein
VRFDQTIHGVPAKTREFCVRAKDQKGIANAGNDQSDDCGSRDSGRTNLHQPEAEENYDGHAGKQVLSRKLEVVDVWKRISSSLAPLWPLIITKVNPFVGPKRDPGLIRSITENSRLGDTPGWDDARRKEHSD